MNCTPTLPVVCDNDWVSDGKVRHQHRITPIITPVRKHVHSSTLADELPWNSTRITGAPVEYVKNLRGHSEGGIVVGGGVETVRSLFLQGLIDELILTTHPVVTNEDRRLFDGSVPPTSDATGVPWRAL